MKLLHKGCAFEKHKVICCIGIYVTYGVFLETLSIFRMHMPTDALHQWTHTVAYIITM